MTPITRPDIALEGSWEVTVGVAFVVVVVVAVVVCAGVVVVCAGVVVVVCAGVVVVCAGVVVSIVVVATVVGTSGEISLTCRENPAQWVKSILSSRSSIDSSCVLYVITKFGPVVLNSLELTCDSSHRTCISEFSLMVSPSYRVTLFLWHFLVDSKLSLLKVTMRRSVAFGAWISYLQSSDAKKTFG